MLIEVHDRRYWLAKIDARIALCEAFRREKDERYENEWRRARWFRRARPDTVKPPPEWPLYPTFWYDGTLEALNQLRRAFLAENTSKILLSQGDLNLIGNKDD